MKIAIVTHVPFWQRSTGAMARIFSMTQYLVNTGIKVEVFFVGHAALAPAPESYLFSVTAAYKTSPLSKFGNWFNRIASGVKQSTTTVDDDPQEIVPMQIDDFKDAAALRSFESFISQHQPEVVVFEYIAMTYLAAWLKATCPGIPTIIDTHDVLSKRNQQFGEYGHRHWLDVTAEQEALALSHYDAVLAIQPMEAEVFKAMVSDRPVIVAGHTLTFDRTDTLAKSSNRFLNVQANTNQMVTLGFLGSRNRANADAINWFLKNCWDELSDDQQFNWQLLITGGVIELIDESYRSFKGILVEPATSDIRSFYKQIDIAINPVRFGTGLKIKNVEALLFGVPLVTSSHGVEGFRNETAGKITVADSPGNFVSLLRDNAKNPEKTIKHAQALQSLAQNEFDPGTVYAEFINWIKSNAEPPEQTV